MRTRKPLVRFAISSANAAVLGLLLACGSSTSISTSPSALSKCAVFVDTPASTIPAAGGSGTIAVKTERECQWTAQPDVAWLTITAGSSGQGDGTVQFNAAANNDPAARTGGVMLNGQRAQISQAAAECRFDLGESSASFPQAGGSGRVDVRASSAQCSWTAASDSPWIAITSGASSRGSAPVVFDVAPTTGPPRTGTLMVAGLHFTVTQSEGCTYAIAPQAFSAGAAGGSSVVTVTAGAGCPWTAASNVNWVSIATAAGVGNGTVAFTVSPTTGPPRTGTLSIAGEMLTVTQSSGCSTQVSPLNQSIGAGGGNGSVNVSAADGCVWSASSNQPWISITSGATGNGSGTVTFAVAATTGPARSGTISVAGEIVTIVQGQGCVYSASPDTQNVPSSGGSGTVAVTAGGGCAWTATSNAPWITIASGASGSGSGTVTFNAASTTGPSRSGTITVAGQTVTVVQGQGCSFTIAPDTQSVASSGGTGTVAVNAAGGCAWTAASNVPWISITAGATGSGAGQVAFTVAGTNGPSRSGTMTIAGRTFTVNQGQGCSVTLSSSSASSPSGGGTGSFDVQTADGCGWSASSNASWLTVTGGASGNGNGTVRYSVAANTGASRSGTITAGGQTFTVTQDVGCTYDISPASQNIGSSGGNVPVGVTAPGGCSWNASSNASWIAISSGASGSGNGTVLLVAAASTEGERRGTVTIAAHTFTLVQASGCTFSIAPNGQSVPAGGGQGSFSVNATASCAWTATSNAPWISVTSGASGSGQGTVQFSAAVNPGPARSGTITAAGQTFTINQDVGCTATVTPEALTSPADGGSQPVNVSTGAECAWTAVSNVPWISIGSGASGTGNGVARFDIQPNSGPARSGSATVAGRTVTANQDGGCTLSITPTGQAVPVAGGPGSVSVTGDGGCAWTAVSNVPWIAITRGAEGRGGGDVQFAVEANATGAPRRGTLTIAGQTFTVDQAGS